MRRVRPRAVLLGNSEGCAMSALFAATYPERVSRLILFGGYVQRHDLATNWDEIVAQRVKLWGTGAMMKRVAPSSLGGPDALAQFGKFERLSASPGEGSRLNCCDSPSSIWFAS